MRAAPPIWLTLLGFSDRNEAVKPGPRFASPTAMARSLTKLQAKSFETLALPFNAASSGDIRRRYAELVRRFHPDSRISGDRSAEEQLSAKW